MTLRDIDYSCFSEVLQSFVNNLIFSQVERLYNPVCIQDFWGLRAPLLVALIFKITSQLIVAGNRMNFVAYKVEDERTAL